jgi:hypothetical protein
MGKALYGHETAGTGGSHKLAFDGIPYRFEVEYCSRANC